MNEPIFVGLAYGLTIMFGMPPQRGVHKGKLQCKLTHMCPKVSDVDPRPASTTAHRGRRIMNHTIRMLVGCLVPLALLFLLPLFGVGSGLTLLLFVGLMFMCHMMMLGGHGHSHGHRKHDTYGNNVNEHDDKEMFR